MLICTSTISKFTTLMDCMRTNLLFPATSREPCLNTRDFGTATGTTMNNFLMKLWKRLCLNLFFTRRMKMLSKLDGFMLYGKLGVEFFSTSNCYIQNMKIRLRLFRARPIFYMVSDNPNVSLGIVDCSLYTRRIAIKDDYHEKRMGMLAYTPVEFNYFQTLAKDFHHSCQTKPVHSRKHFQQCSSLSDCYCNEYKLCIHWLLY